MEAPLLFFVSLFSLIFTVSAVGICSNGTCGVCSKGTCGVGDMCSENSDCHTGLTCQGCPSTPDAQPFCTRSQVNIPTSTVGGGLPFNKFSWLVTHNAFSNRNDHYNPYFIYFQEDNVTMQLRNGVRGMTLIMSEFQNDIWLCQTVGQPCMKGWTYGLALDTLREVEAFLRKNPTQVVTLFIDDHVHARNGLRDLFKKAELDKYWFPVSKMPKNGQDWPLVDEMVRQNHRLLVFTSNASKEATEGIAYRWRYILENEPWTAGFEGCMKRDESMDLDSRNASLVMMNHFTYHHDLNTSCVANSGLADMIPTCIKSAGYRVPNFVAVDFYMRGVRGGIFDALDQLNAQSACGCNTTADCQAGRKCKSPEWENRCPNILPSYCLLLMALIGGFILS